MIPSSKSLVFGVAAVLIAAGSSAMLAQGRGGQSAAPRSGTAMSTGSSAAAPAVLPEYRIGVEDILDIQVMTHDDLKMLGIQVRPDGRISMPLVNDIQAVGLTPMELRGAIIKALQPHWKDQEVSVTVREVRSSKFFVIGAVRATGKFTLISQTTVLEAIAMAGGLLTEFADTSKIHVLHSDGSRVAFNYKKFMSDPGSEVNFLLKSGDIVVVPER